MRIGLDLWHDSKGELRIQAVLLSGGDAWRRTQHWPNESYAWKQEAPSWWSSSDNAHTWWSSNEQNSAPDPWRRKRGKRGGGGKWRQMGDDNNRSSDESNEEPQPGAKQWWHQQQWWSNRMDTEAAGWLDDEKVLAELIGNATDTSAPPRSCAVVSARLAGYGGDDFSDKNVAAGSTGTVLEATPWRAHEQEEDGGDEQQAPKYIFSGDQRSKERQVSWDSGGRDEQEQSDDDIGAGMIPFSLVPELSDDGDEQQSPKYAFPGDQRSKERQVSWDSGGRDSDLQCPFCESLVQPLAISGPCALCHSQHQHPVSPSYACADLGCRAITCKKCILGYSPPRSAGHVRKPGNSLRRQFM